MIKGRLGNIYNRIYLIPKFVEGEHLVDYADEYSKTKGYINALMSRLVCEVYNPILTGKSFSEYMSKEVSPYKTTVFMLNVYAPHNEPFPFKKIYNKLFEVTYQSYTYISKDNRKFHNVNRCIDMKQKTHEDYLEYHNKLEYNDKYQ